MVYEGIVNSCGNNIHVSTNSRRVIEFCSDVTSRAIPGYGFLPVMGSQPTPKINFRVTIIESDTGHGIRYDEAGNLIEMGFREDSFVENDIEMLFIWIFNHLYSTDGLVCSYSIGITKDPTQGIVIIGEWGSGKSIVSLRLLRQGGYRYVGNDRTVIHQQGNEIMMFSGSSPIRLRLGTVAKYFPDLLPNSIPKSSPWGSFISYNPQKLGIEQVENVRVGYIFRVKVMPISDENCTCNCLTEMDGRFAAVKLYHSISYFSIDFNLINLTTGSFYPQFDTAQKAAMRIQMANKLLEQAAAYEVYGNLNWVVEKISNIVGGSPP
jgi:hypothetical protein